MTDPSRTYLLVTWDGGGNVSPQLAVARRLAERGHRVHVVADPTVADRGEAIAAEKRTDDLVARPEGMGRPHVTTA